MPSARSILAPSILLLAVGFSALLGIVAMTFWLGERSQAVFQEVIAARDARTATVELRSALVSAETSQRGYLLTGNQIYLAPLATSRARISDELEKVASAFAAEARLQPALARLRAIVREKLEETDRTIALKREGQDEEAAAIVRTNRGKALTDEANVFLTGMIRSVDARLIAAVADQTRIADLLRQATLAGFALIVAVVGLVAWIVVRYTRALQAANREVLAFNETLEQRVRDRTADLARANDEIQRFAYIVTHDLRAPLVNIMGFTGEVESGIASLRKAMDDAAAGRGDAASTLEARAALDADLPEAIGFIRSSTRKMDGLISAILKLSREGRRRLRPEPILLKESVEAALAALRHQLEEADGEATVTIAGDGIVSDRMALDQVLGNLLDNAVKYRVRGRPLRIAVTVAPLDDGHVEIAIADNGRGIAEGDHERVFEPFRRAGIIDTPGEGIGLTHVRTIVRNLGGDIALTSAMDVGTTFRIVLPRRLDVAEGPAA